MHRARQILWARAASAILSVASMLGSVGASGCGASINAAYKADIDRRVASLHASAMSYPSSDATEPMPLAVGQWEELKIVDAKQQPGFLTYKIVGQQGDAFWIESVSETYAGKSETRMLVNLGDRKNLETVSISAFKLRHDDGRVEDYPPNLLGMLKALWKPIVNNLLISWHDLPRDDARVIAGDFAGCYKRRSTVTFGPYEQTSDSWQHPAVPINGLVRSVGVDKPMSMELVAFGTEGAKSSF